MDQATEESSSIIGNLETLPGPGTEVGLEKFVSYENTDSIASDKQTRNAKNTAGNAKSESTNAGIKNLKTASDPERKNLKRKAVHVPTSEMVMDSIRALKKRNGATFEDIRKYMEENYAINMKIMKSHINRFLQKSVDAAVLEKILGAGVQEKYKIKKSENIKKDSENVHRKEGKVKPTKKVAASGNLRRKERKVKTTKKVAAPKKLSRKEGKIKTAKKVSAAENLRRKEGKVKPAKKMAASKTQAKK